MRTTSALTLARRRSAAAIAAVALFSMLSVDRSIASTNGLPASADLAPGSQPWIFARLGEADALLRGGRPRAAARAFRDVFVNAQGTEWGTMAELGLAWSVATSGDLELARALAEDAHAAAGPAAETTGIILALLHAQAGDGRAAMTLLDRAAAASNAGHESVLALARAYVLFWSGDHPGAAAAFDGVVGSSGAGSLADDARYGAAWSRFKAGEREPAIAALEALMLAAPAGFDFRAVPQRLVELDPRAVVADGTRRYRRGGRLPPGAELARLLDGDGFSRAHSALRLLDPARFGRPLAPPPSLDLPVAAADIGTAPAAAEARLPSLPNDQLSAAARVEADAARHDLLRVLLGLLALVLLALAGWFLTRRGDRRRGALSTGPKARRGRERPAAPGVGA
jgi:hypothetical protein